MGADIYLQSVNGKCMDWQLKFEKYSVKQFQLVLQIEKVEKNPLIGTMEKSVSLNPLQKALDEAREKTREAYHNMEGYYRDSYNGSATLSMLGLSWLDLGCPVPPFGIPLIDDEGRMDVASCAKLLMYLEAIDFDKTFAACVERNEKSDFWRNNFYGKDNTIAGWQKHHWSQFGKLKSMLKRAIELKEGLYCDL